MRRIRLLPLLLLLPCCYNPKIADRMQQCTPDNKCPQGFTCAVDHFCYHNGITPDCSPACAAPTPQCDPTMLRCVECLKDEHCPTGKVCTAQKCVAGCSATHSTCPMGQSCDLDGGVSPSVGACRGCLTDSECAAADPTNPRCETTSQKCVPCLPKADNCAMGTYCVTTNGTYSCATGCKADNDCNGGQATGSDAGTLTDAGGAGTDDAMMTAGDDSGMSMGDFAMSMASDGGTTMMADGGTTMKALACCNHVCVDKASDNGNCGQCGLTCGANTACCGSFCLSTAGDPNNCGGCGKVCNVPNAVAGCSSSKCTIAQCNNNYVDCDKDPGTGCEVNTSSDVNNCGACGTPCTTPKNAASVSCMASKCAVATCAGTFADCNATFSDGCEVDTSIDKANCGGCGARFKCPNPVNGTPSCVMGMCGIGGCANGFGDCDAMVSNGCESVFAGDSNNCGGCTTGTINHKCAATQVCANGNCVTSTCPGTKRGCNGGTCNVDVSNDPLNCAACNNKCPTNVGNATFICQGSLCTLGPNSCNMGFADCNMNINDGCEINLQTDPNHCGMCKMAVCGQISHGTPGCRMGSCSATCGTGFGDCDNNYTTGCESNLYTDNNNCGGCGKPCATGQTCVAGACQNNIKLIVVSPDIPPYRQDVVQKLQGTGSFSVIDQFDARFNSPSLAQLQPYDAVLFYSGFYYFPDPTGMGDSLASYVDGGGHVVVCAWGNITNNAPQGRFSNYLLLAVGARDQGGTDGLGTIAEPNLSIMAGVQTLSMAAQWRGVSGPVNNTTTVAQWASGRPLAVRGAINGRNRVDLNLFPLSGNILGGGWTGDGAILMRNALFYK